MDALRYALAAAHIHPSAPMMVTIFDRTIGDQLVRFLPECDVTSPADLAANQLRQHHIALFNTFNRDFARSSSDCR